MSVDKVWVIDLPVHVIADTAELAREHLAQVCDRGEVRLQSADGRGYVTVLYVNYPEDRGYDGQQPYVLDEFGHIKDSLENDVHRQ